MADHPELPGLHRETIESLVTDAFRAAREALALNEQLRRALDREAISEAQCLNDDIFVVLSDLYQRIEQAIATGPEPDRGPDPHRRPEPHP